MIRNISIGIIILLLFIIPSQALAAISQAAKPILLTIDDAINLGLKLDADVSDAKKNLSKNRTEYKQSLHAIINESQKDASPYARPHSLSKDLSIRLKLPEARKSLTEAKENLVQQERLAADKVRKLYISTIGMMNNVSDATTQSQVATDSIKEAKTLAKLGKAKRSDVEEAENAKKSTDSQLKQAKLNYKSALLEMGRAIGRDMEQGYTFELKPEYVDVKADTIWKLIGHAEKNDIDLSSAAMNRSIANEKVQITRQLYTNKFGSTDMKIIESMFNKEINEELFEANYEMFLQRVEKQWEGLTTLLIPLPKSLFQGEFDGIRYFDDQRYSLPVSLFDLAKARMKEQDTLEQLLTGIKTSYLTFKAAEEVYAQSLQQLASVKQDHIKASTKLKIKQISKEQYVEMEEKLNDANKKVGNSYIAYYSAMYQLDLDTSGGLLSVIKKGVLPWMSLDDGLSPINSSPDMLKPLLGQYEVKPVVEPITSSITINVDQSLGSTHYQLFTMENIALTPATPVGQPIVLLTMLMQSINDYQVVFFKQQLPVAQATFEGIGTTGTLAIAEISKFEEKKTAVTKKPRNDLGTIIIGTFQIALSQLTKDIASVALASAVESGQGIYYQPADAVDQWVDLEKTLEYEDILNNNVASIVDKTKMDELKITVSIQSSGALESLQTTEQLEIDINGITLAIEQLQAEADKATKSGQLFELAQIMQEIDTSVSKKGFLESLLLEDSGETWSQLVAWSSAQSGEAPTSDEGDEVDILADASEERKEQLQLALKFGSPDEIRSAAIQYAEALLALQSELQGVQQEIESLLGAKTKLEEAYDEAHQTNDEARVNLLLEALEAIQSELQIAEKQSLFVQKETLEYVIEQLSEEGQFSKPLTDQRTKAIGAITELEKLKYEEQELIALSEETELIIELYEGEIVPIPAQNVISGAYQIKLDLPPIFTEGHAMLQIRPISESFGALVVWNDIDQSVTITKNGIVVICKVGELTAYVNGEPYMMEVAPQLILGRTVVPLRFIAITLGIDVDWDSHTSTIELSDKGDIQQ